MKTMNDLVREHAKKSAGSASTLDGIEFLGLPHSGEFNAAGNTYLAALDEIRKLRKALKQAENIIWQHHESGHIEHMHNSTGDCDVCTKYDKTIEEIDELLAGD